MALLLAPYNASMRLGQGFNSYTQEICLDQAVKVPEQATRNIKSPPQIVSYSSRFVEKLSDVVDTMNVSYSATIKKGTVEISGNSATLDETNFKSADLNAIVSVRVINQTTSAQTGCDFRGLRGCIPGTATFNEVYGDCYISGFMEGGDFTGMISIMVLDRNNVKEVTNQIKSSLGSYGKEEVTLDPFENGGNQLKALKAIQDTECTVSVSWMGGGQIKDATTQWDLNSMFAAAAAFPGKVANCPQKTWAILTKYKANRSFVRKARFTMYRTLEYDQISSYTAELFDNFMDYKLLLKSLQQIIRNRDAYLVKPSENSNASIDMSMKTLLSLRSAFRDEQAKIVDAIEVLSRDPGILRRQTQNGHRPYKSLAVRKVIEDTIGMNLWNKDTSDASPIKGPSEVETLVLLDSCKDDDTDDASSISDLESESPEEDKAAETLKKGENKEEKEKAEKSMMLSFDFDKLIPPEIWEDLMPRSKGASMTASAPTAASDNPNPITSPSGTNTLAGIKKTVDKPVPDDFVYPDAIVSQLREELNACKAKLAETQSNLQNKSNDLEQILGEAEGHKVAKQKAEQATAAAERMGKEEREKAERVEKDLAAARQTITEQKRKLEAQASDIQTLNGDINKAVADADRLRGDLQVAKGRMLDSNPRGRIWIAAVFWGTLRIDTTYPDTLQRLYELAESKQLFTPNVTFFNNQNPWSGDITMFVEYRIDETGPMRYLVLREGVAGQFPVF